ncbi:unnamed protein product [Rotaria sp. Silwood1]|nr:unnamed protein product [Rotaria sp. Silwood1]
MPILPPIQSKSDEIINILLLGESGVGKSTFINALVNYLKFKTLKEAENNPIVLIPVSFMIMTGDNFEEHLVKFEGSNFFSNEDHNHLGQSVTQHCKSYVFTLTDGESRGRKLRIIDTPGIGDTRDSSQDDANLQHILSYINNLTHLNAVCILLKPNNVRLNALVRSCFMQLIDMLSENVCDKIIFCFTNARRAFYTPGDTVPALKDLLQSLPIKKLSFTRENTFLMYKGIVPGKSYSMKQAQLKINLMVRPMLESMRNILRNLILRNVSESHKTCIKLHPNIIKYPTAICLRCPRKSFQIDEFWFTMDSLHVFVNNKCLTCQCDPSDHYPIDYELVYKRFDDLSSSFFLKNTSVEVLDTS